MQVDIFGKKRRERFVFFLSLSIVTFASMVITEFDVAKAFSSIYKAVFWALTNFYPDVNSLTKLPSILIKLRETAMMSISATIIAAIFALGLSIMGSATTRVNQFFSVLSRGIASVFRNIPVVAWAMVLLFSFGQSSLTGFFALFFVSFGFLTRAFIETIDEASNSSVEALQATGASYLHIIVHAVMPSSMPQMLSWMLFMLETNIRAATLVGILTGTGIGFSFNLYYKSMNYHAASLVVILIVLTVFAVEGISNYIRRVIL